MQLGTNQWKLITRSENTNLGNGIFSFLMNKSLICTCYQILENGNLRTA